MAISVDRSCSSVKLMEERPMEALLYSCKCSIFATTPVIGLLLVFSQSVLRQFVTPKWQYPKPWCYRDPVSLLP